jgi:hypothetical protein
MAEVLPTLARVQPRQPLGIRVHRVSTPLPKYTQSVPFESRLCLTIRLSIHANPTQHTG